MRCQVAAAVEVKIGDRQREGSGANDDNCAIVERTVLNSPVAEVIEGLQIGSILLVELETQPRNRVVTKTLVGAIAGAITSPNLVDFIECLQGGYAFEAEVKSVTGGRVEIEIRPA